MADNSKIVWCDATLNYANGCSLASPGCTNCYAMKQAHRFPVRQGLTVQSKGGMVWTGEVRMNDKALHQAIAWKRGRRIFWNAHGDLFHEKVTDAQIDRQFAACALSPQHTHMILTKRSDRMRKYFSNWPDGSARFWHIYSAIIDLLYLDGRAGQGWSSSDEGYKAAVKRAHEALGMHEGWTAETLKRWPLPNVWLGVSVEDQQRADERIPDLLATPAAVRFISAEPLLGPVDLGAVRWNVAGYTMIGALPDPGEADDFRWAHHEAQGIRWVIIGTESGHHARHMDNAWAQQIVDQCQAAGVAVMVKQLSSGTARPLHDIEQFPEGLRIREFPNHG